MSDAAKHTPGPWKRKGVLVYALHKVPSWRDEVNVFSCQVQGNGEYGAEQEELEANARLIQLAPEFLQFAKDEVDTWRGAHNNCQRRSICLVCRAQALIAKAEGKSDESDYNN